VKLFQILIFLCCSAIFNAWSQSLQTTSFVFDDSGFDEIMVAGYSANGIFVLQSNLPIDSDRDRVGFRSRKYRISFFDDKLNRRWYENVEAGVQGASVQAVFFSMNKMTAVCTAQQKVNTGNQVSIYVQHYFDDNRKSESRLTGNVNLTGSPEKLRVLVSENKQLTAILIPEFINDELLRIHYLLLDSTFNQMNSKVLDLSCRKKNFQLEDYILSNSGDVALLTIQQVREGKKRLDEYKVYLSQPGEAVLFEKVVSREQIETAGAGIVFDNQHNRLVCAGFMADPSLASRTSIFIHSIPVSNPGQSEQRLVPIDNRYKFKLVTISDKQGDGLFTYPIRKMILRDDGGIVLIAEAFYVYEYSYYDYFTQSYMRRIEYQFNNIVSISIDPDDQIHWLHIIRKTQESTDDGGIFSSFLQFSTSNELVMIYNAFNKRRNEVQYSVMDPAGRFEESKTIPLQLPVLLMPRFGRQVSVNEAVIPCITGKKQSLARVIF